MQFLYRAFTSQDRLLYVGITSNWAARLGEHAEGSDWMELCTRLTVEKFETREEVERAEIAAIKKEQPLYNKAHNDSYKSAWRHLNDFFKFVRGLKKPDKAHNFLVEMIRTDAEEVYGLNSSLLNRNSVLFLLEETLSIGRWRGETFCAECEIIIDTKWEKKRLSDGERYLLEGGTGCR